METLILKLVFDYSKSGKLVDKNFIDKLIDIVVNANELGNYVRKLIIDNNVIESSNGVDVAAYNLLQKDITVYPSAIESFIKRSDRFDHLFNGTEQIFYRNLLITQFILHELEHADQNKKVDSKESDIETKLLKTSFREIQAIKNPKLLELMYDGDIDLKEFMIYFAVKRQKYEQYYKQAPSERLAQIKSFRTINSVLEPIKNYVPNLTEFEKASLLEQSLRGYSESGSFIYCPTQTYLEGCGYSDIWQSFDFNQEQINNNIEEVSKQYNLGKRLMLGLPIFKQEYDSTLDTLHSTNKYN